jgi:hypothetical protein
MRVTRFAVVASVLLAAAGIGAIVVAPGRTPKPRVQPVLLDHAEQGRQQMFAESQPVKLANCGLERFGEKNDGGYLLCGNLLGEVRSAYSYGISGYDQWGCDVSTKLTVPVHEYDCFNLTRPRCPTGKLVFHGECIGNSRRTEDGRPFDTLENQVEKNGDAGKRLVVKMDVEGAEWESFLGSSSDFLERIDQMAVEFHGIDQWQRSVEAIWKLKQHFYIANLHWNNFACDTGEAPFPASVYELLLVSKRIGVLEPGAPVVPSLLNRPNNPGWRDCQTLTAK